jgi:hypothetical protein
MPYSDFSYNPQSFSEIDNIFPEATKRTDRDTAKYALTHLEFAEKIKEYAGDGDVIEFGVCTGGTILPIGKANPERKVFGFDHFKGLEQTLQPTPSYSGWIEGAFRVGDPNYVWSPKSIEEVINRCSESPNIQIFVEDVHELKDPSKYGISKIGAVHIDLDIYEPTVSALKFIDKCEWDEIYFRFDDWHGHEPDYDHHERKAFREWLDRGEYKFEIYEDGLNGGCKVWKSN